jgi:hypothetical protein
MGTHTRLNLVSGAEETIATIPSRAIAISSHKYYSQVCLPCDFLGLIL